MSKHKHHERKMHSYDRRHGKRSPNQYILIVCEGKETEPNYFESLRNHLKLPTVSVKIIGRAGAPISLVKEAQAQINKRKQDRQHPGFEDIWCVFDVENPYLNPTFNEAVKIADQEQYHLAISNPAFEFWYILHFEYTDRPFDNGMQVKEYLKRHYIPDYQPSKKIFNELILSIDKARKHACKLQEKQPQSQNHFPNPSTQVHLLVEKMISMSSSMREHFE